MNKLIKKTVLILVVCLCLLVSIGSIYAEDMVDSDEIGASDDMVDIGDGADGSHIPQELTYDDLKDVIYDAEENSVVYLSDNYKFTENTQLYDYDMLYYHDEGVRISKNITLVGTDNTYIDGDNQARCLFIKSGHTVTLENITFKNGFRQVLPDSSSYWYDGGAIFVESDSNLIIKNCVFLNNKVFNANGGAIDCKEHVNISIYNSKFINNTAVRESDLPWEKFKRGMASAILVNLDSSLKMYDCVFDGNDAYVATVLVISYDDYQNKTSTAYVDGCTFENNVATTNCAFYLDEFGKGEFINSTFRNNKVTSKNGILVLEASLYALVKNCVFEKNSAVLGAITTFNYDGATSTVEIIGSRFSKNTAEKTGGAIHLDSGTIKISGSTFEGNSANNGGGAIFALQGTIQMSDSKFENNKATYGGAILLQNNANTFNNLVFTKNTATETGGAILALKGSLKLTNSKFENNKANYGGAILLQNDANTLSNLEFTKNTATESGGAVYSKLTNIVSSNCKFVSNSAKKAKDVYGVVSGKLTKVSVYFGTVQIKVQLTSGWKNLLSQNIRLNFIGAGGNHYTPLIKTNSKGEVTVTYPYNKLTLGNYKVNFYPESGVSLVNPINIKVIQAPCKASLKKVTVKYHKVNHVYGYLKNSKNNKAVMGAKLKVKVYTGKKCSTYTVTTDKNGAYKVFTSKLSVGKHKVVVTAANKNIKMSQYTSWVKIKK